MISLLVAIVRLIILIATDKERKQQHFENLETMLFL